MTYDTIGSNIYMPSGCLTAAGIWVQWNTVYYATNITSATSATNAAVWTAWNTAAAATTSLGTSSITYTQANALNVATWAAFNERYEVIRSAGEAARRIQRYSRRHLSEAELLAELEREKKLREEAEKREREAKEANARAEQLLRACLSPQQIEDLEKKNCFYIEIDGRDGRREKYRIDRGSHGNVKQVDEKGSIIRSFCVQPPGVPIPDVMLTQKLYLEASEETRQEFWETANITHLMQEKAIPHSVPRANRRRYAQEHGLLH